jgi:hypothetical protein
MLELRKRVFDILNFGAKFIFLVPIEKRPQPYYVLLHNRRILLGQSTETLDENDLAYTIAHSMLAFILRHDTRCQGLIANQEDSMIWNMASEICRSSVMADLRITIGKDIFLSPGHFKLDYGLSVEEYFYKLKEKFDEWKDKFQAKAQIVPMGKGGQQQDDSQPNSQSHSLSDEEKREIQELIGEHPLLNAMQSKVDEHLDSLNDEELSGLANEALLEEASRDALNALGRSLASRNQDVKMVLKQLKPMRNPFENMVQFIGSKLGSSEFRKLNVARPNRRYQGYSDVIVPAFMRTAFQKMMVIVDVSGSVHGFIDKIANALYSLGKTYGDSLDVFFSDIDVLETKENFDPEFFKEIPLGGGTDLGPIVDRLVKKNGYEVVFMITDGLTSWPNRHRGVQIYCWLIKDKHTQVKDLNIPDYIKVEVYELEKED